MITINLAKIVAGSAVAAVLLPSIASAHGFGFKLGADVNVGAAVSTRIDKALDRIEHKGDTDNNKEDRQDKQATTTAAHITAKATRIQATVDAMTSFGPRVQALIASSSADGQAALQATYANFTSAAANAKLKAGAAITGAAQVNAANSTTTNASLIAQAKVDLGSARDFLRDATQALFSVLRSLWK